MTDKPQIAPTQLIRTRYGTAHPERVESQIFELCFRNGWTAYQLGEHLGSHPDLSRDPSLSTYRDEARGPLWSWERFGRTSTRLPDGRTIHVAGEHEDSYDPDFCIFNDVTVEHPDGGLEFYLYPMDAFPPTDFHSATLIGDDIVIIGSLGYRDLRRTGEAQVLKLDTRSLRFTPLVTSGDCPGWISRHIAETISATSILIAGGKIATSEGYVDNLGLFELDLTTLVWRRRPHGDIDLLPISAADYRTLRNPRYGARNPDLSTNPFWYEMARRKWSPMRARLHFGDFPPPEPKLTDASFVDLPDPRSPDFQSALARMSEIRKSEKLKRTIDDVIWTAEREEAVELDLPDGRSLLIGGSVADYGDNYADPWTYNDIVVTHPDGTLEVYTYSKDVFPQLNMCKGIVLGGALFLFGVIDSDFHPDEGGKAATVRIALDNLAAERLRVPFSDSCIRIMFWGLRVDNNLVSFPLARRDDTVPHRRIAFDLDTLKWGEPYLDDTPPDSD